MMEGGYLTETYICSDRNKMQLIRTELDQTDPMDLNVRITWQSCFAVTNT